jgi:hypothetical protein
VPAVVKLSALWKPGAVAVASSGAPAGSLIDDPTATDIDVPEDKEQLPHGDLAVMRLGDTSPSAVTGLVHRVGGTVRA